MFRSEMVKWDIKPELIQRRQTCRGKHLKHNMESSGLSWKDMLV